MPDGVRCPVAIIIFSTGRKSRDCKNYKESIKVDRPPSGWSTNNIIN